MDNQIDIFISYSSKDSTIANSICQYLEKENLLCWIAPRNVRAGYDYGAEIVSAIKASKAVILVFSKNSNISRDVTNEVNLAFTKGKIIIPFKIEEAEISEALEYYLGRVHWINATSQPASHFEGLLKQCLNAVGRTNKPGVDVKRKPGDIEWINDKSGNFTDPRDGHIYKVVKIGTQIWLAENLAYIPHVSPPEIQGGIWVYDYFGTNVDEAINTVNYKEYGCLYDWWITGFLNEVCPPGWHLPSENDVSRLTGFIDKEFFSEKKFKLIADHLKSKSGWYGNLIGKDTFGFRAIPGGCRDFQGTFNFIGYDAYWWLNELAKCWVISYSRSDVEIYNYGETMGHSVRCLINI